MQYGNQDACNLSAQLGINPQPVKKQGLQRVSENFFTLSEQGTHLIADPSLVPKPGHEEECHFSLHV